MDMESFLNDATDQSRAAGQAAPLTVDNRQIVNQRLGDSEDRIKRLEKEVGNLRGLLRQAAQAGSDLTRRVDGIAGTVERLVEDRNKQIIAEAGAGKKPHAWKYETFGTLELTQRLTNMETDGWTILSVGWVFSTAHMFLVAYR